MDFSFLDEQSNEGIKKYINYIDNNSDRINEIAFYLASKGNLEIIEYLISQKKININVKKGSQILFNACASGNIELVKYLLDHGVKEKDVLKVSIKKDYYILFKHIVKENKSLLEELRKEENNEWKQILQNRLDNWLEKQCNKKNVNKEDIKLLLFCGARYEIFYSIIEKLIEKGWCFDFIEFIKIFENDASIIEKIKQYVKKKEKLQKQLNDWLEEYKKYKFDRDILIKCGADDIVNYKTTIKPKISAPYLANDTYYSSSLTKEFDLTDKDNC